MNKRIDSIVSLRMLAIVLVVFGHATRDIQTPNPHMYNPSATVWWEIFVSDYINSFHMPLFFWISGYVFYYSVIENVKSISPTMHLVEKVKRLILPMYATSYLILLPTIFLFGHINGSIEHQVRLFFFGLNNDHLWFLKALFLIFIIMIIPTYVVKFNNKHYCLTIFLLTLVLFTLKPSLFGTALKYIPFFALGYISRKHEFVCKKLNSLHGFILMVFLHIFVFLSTELNFFIEPNRTLYYATALFGIYSMYYLVSILTPFFISWNLLPFIKSIETRSYSIYLFHVTFIYLILFLFAKYDIKAPTARIFLSFLTGLLAPIILHDLFSKYYFVSHIFSIPYKNKKS